MEHESQYALLDRMGQAAVAFGGDRSPLFITSEAARILQIRTRDAVVEHRTLLAPLAKALGDSSAAESLFGQQRSLEIRMHTADGVPVPVLAAGFSTGASGEELVTFWDLRPFQTWMTLVQQSLRVRPALVYAAALLGQPLNVQAVEALFRHSQLTGVGIQEGGRVDLLNLLTAAVEIVDSLASPTFRINVDLPTPALLSLSRAAALRLICHILLEAADYAGPLGRAKVGAFFQPGSVQVMVLAIRPDPGDLAFGPLQLHLMRKAMITDYRVAKGGSAGEPPLEERSFLERHISAERGELSLDLIRAIPEESFSENLRIASHVADSMSLLLEAKLVPPKQLLFSLFLPLEDNKI